MIIHMVVRQNVLKTSLPNKQEQVSPLLPVENGIRRTTLSRCTRLTGSIAKTWKRAMKKLALRW